VPSTQPCGTRRIRRVTNWRLEYEGVSTQKSNPISNLTNLSVLAGDHQEQAVLFVSTVHKHPTDAISAACKAQLKATGVMTTPFRPHPAPLPHHVNFTSFFTVHGDSGGQIAPLRHQIARFFTDILIHQRQQRADSGASSSASKHKKKPVSKHHPSAHAATSTLAHQFFTRLNALAAVQFNATSAHLQANIKPAFTATITLAARHIPLAKVSPVRHVPPQAVSPGDHSSEAQTST